LPELKHRVPRSSELLGADFVVVLMPELMDFCFTCVVVLTPGLMDFCFTCVVVLTPELMDFCFTCFVVDVDRRRRMRGLRVDPCAKSIAGVPPLLAPEHLIWPPKSANHLPHELENATSVSSGELPLIKDPDFFHPSVLSQICFEAAWQISTLPTVHPKLTAVSLNGSVVLYHIVVCVQAAPPEHVPSCDAR
jgi:hypothetical protein